MKRLLILVLLLSGVASFGQAPAAASPAVQETGKPETTFSIGSTLVRVPVIVNTSKGEPVFAMTAEDFHLTDDGYPQKVRVDEDTGAQPISLVICVETGNEGARHLDDYDNLQTLLEQLVGAVPHQVAVVAFDSTPKIVKQFTPNIYAAYRAVEDTDEGNNGAAILDALQTSVTLLDQRPATDRRAILLLSETLDHGSHISLQQAVRSVSDTNTTIYALSFNSTRAEVGHELSRAGGDSTPGPANGCMGEIDKLAPDAPANKFSQAYGCLSLLAPPLRLVKMALLVAMNSFRKNVPETAAKLSGGEYLPFSNAKSFDKGLYQFTNHLPNQYVLSYTPKAPHPGLHTLQVTMTDRPQLKVTARASYWVDGP